MTNFDGFDIRILAALQEDASLSIAQIAELIHLSSNACWRRIKRLEDEGVIVRRVAILDPVKLGVRMTAFVSVRAAEHSEAWLEEFANAVRRIPEIVEFHRMSGDIDYLLKLRVADVFDYDRVYKSLIRNVRLADVSSSFSMEEIKATTAIPLPRV